MTYQTKQTVLLLISSPSVTRQGVVGLSKAVAHRMVGPSVGCCGLASGLGLVEVPTYLGGALQVTSFKCEKLGESEACILPLC